VRGRAPRVDGPPLLVLLLPARLEQFAYFIAHRQARRMRLPGTPRAVAAFDVLQVPLAVALTQRHPGAELWQLGTEPADGPDSALVLDLGAASDLRGVWSRAEALGIESGRLGSERDL
jgi:hypothetical protein